MEDLPAREAVDQLDAADLDQPMPLIGVEAGGFGIEHDLAHCQSSESEFAANQRRRFGIVATCAQDLAHLRARVVESLRGIHDEIGAPALFGVRHLPRQHGFELVRRHAGPLQHAGALHLGRRRHHHHRVDPLSPPVSNSSGMSSTATGAPRLPPRPGTARSASCTSGWTIASSCRSAAGSPITRRAELDPVDLAVGGGAGKRRLDRPAPPRLHRDGAPPRRRHAPARPPPRRSARWSTCPCATEPVRPSTNIRYPRSARSEQRLRAAGNRAPATAAGREW